MMPFARAVFKACFAVAFASDAVAQEAPAQRAPLSVIDWLGAQETLLPTAKMPEMVLDEPPVSATGAVPEVQVKPLTEGRPRQIGLVPSTVTGMPATLWSGSEPARLTKLITSLPELRLPAAQSLLYTLLLADAQAPGQSAPAGDALALARTTKLMSLGALDPAMSLIEEAGVSTSPDHFDLWMQISLLLGTEDRACARLSQAPHLTRDYGVRIFCAARAGNWENASLTFGAAQALKLMPDAKLMLFDRFLHPEGFEDAPPLPVPSPREIDPLTFRLFETIGEPLSTRPLPRAYAVADLRDVAGWKAQLEAAERLSRAGALPHNQLLGYLTSRRPAASGGVWDRVAAFQRFDTALNTASAEAVSKTLLPAWQAAEMAAIEVPFAALFAERLRPIALEGPAKERAALIALLSPEFDAAAATQILDRQLVTQIARGELPQDRPEGGLPLAVYQAFRGLPPRPDLLAAAQQNRLGEAILEILKLLQQGTEGDPVALRDALTTLRALGFEDAARRAALEVLILEL
ncbi:MAG: hypothetical protein AAF755_13000 [Pseudomonadota bacterium]